MITSNIAGGDNLVESSTHCLKSGLRLRILSTDNSFLSPEMQNDTESGYLEQKKYMVHILTCFVMCALDKKLN